VQVVERVERAKANFEASRSQEDAAVDDAAGTRSAS
jgi:hypothetical protein